MYLHLRKKDSKYKKLYEKMVIYGQNVLTLKENYMVNVKDYMKMVIYG